MTEKIRKQENIKSFCRFIDNFVGELTIKFLDKEDWSTLARRNEIWCGNDLVATFKNSEVYIQNKQTWIKIEDKH